MSGHDDRGSDRGAATVLAAVVCALLLLLGSALGTVGAVVVDLRRAQAAADLAALGAAAGLGRGEDACATGSVLAHDNGARLVSCTVSGREVRLEVEVPGPRWFGLVADPAAEARAGPVT